MIDRIVAGPIVRSVLPNPQRDGRRNHPQYNQGMLKQQRARFSKTLVEGFVCLLVALVIYYGGFRAMESNVAVTVSGPSGSASFGHEPKYSVFGHAAIPQGFWQTFFLPAWLVDRAIRTDYWYPP